MSANGRELSDIIAWWWESEGSTVPVTVAAPVDTGGAGTPRLRDVTLVRDPGEPWGVEFASALFDGVRTCRNRCAFCFMAQLPPGLRPALYVRDDDYRLSFLDGNFITLTNLDDSDIERIASEHLSPLHVSLHAVSMTVRQELVCAREDRALERFDQLLDAGIDLHVQVVLVPGVNDGEELDATLGWLAAREGVVSVGIVPLGYTAHQKVFSRSYESVAASSALLDSIEPWAKAMRDRDGIGWVYAADEFYLNAGRPVPLAGSYDGYPQFENGIGLVRSFLDDIAALTRATPAAPGRGPVTVITGEMFAPALRALIEPLELAGRVTVLPVANRFFGGNVGVTGLLTGSDVIAALASTDPDAAVLLPDVLLNDDGLTLDDMRPEGIATAARRRVTVVPSNAEGLLSGIL